MSELPKKPPRNPFADKPVLGTSSTQLRSPLLDTPKQTAAVDGPALRSPLLDAVKLNVAAVRNPFDDETPATSSTNPFGEEGSSPRLNPFGTEEDADTPARAPGSPRKGIVAATAVARGPSLLRPQSSPAPIATLVVASTSSAVPAPANSTYTGDSDADKGVKAADIDVESTFAPRGSDVIPRQTPSKTVHMREASIVSVAVMLSQHEKEQLSANKIYYKNTLSDRWLIMAMVAHIIQWGILLAVSRPQMSTTAFGFCLLLAILVVLLLMGSRLFTKKKPRVDLQLLGREQLTPEDEEDDVSPFAVHMLATAALCEGIAYAVFTSSVAGPGKIFGDIYILLLHTSETYHYILFIPLSGFSP